MLPDKTYLVRFTKVDGSVEVWEHMKKEDARMHFSLFDESDQDIYTEIQLIERNWKTNTDTILEVK